MSKKKQKEENLDNNNKKEVKQPYSHMFARKIVLLIGLVITLLGFIAVLLGALVLFLPGINVIQGMKPITQIIYLMAAGLVACFVGVVFAVAGANTIKPLARLSFFLGSVAFIAGAALLVICLFFQTILPIPALERLSQPEASEVFSRLL